LTFDLFFLGFGEGGGGPGVGCVFSPTLATLPSNLATLLASLHY